MNAQLPPMMTSDEVAAVLNVHRETVLRWARQGHLTGHKVGQRWRFTPQDVQHFLDRRRFPTPNG